MTHIRLVRSAFATAMISAACSLAGCGPTTGAWLYTLGLVPDEKVPAEYKLPKDTTVMILVDDDQDLIQPPDARFAVVDELAKLLKKHEIASRVTTNEEIAEIRQKEQKFHERGVRELGQLANADTVIWLSTIQFSMASDLEMMITPARFSALLKVINARAETRQDVRLWPPTGDGRLVEAAVNPHDIRACKTISEAHNKVAAELAEQVVNLFYDRVIER